MDGMSAPVAFDRMTCSRVGFFMSCPTFPNGHNVTQTFTRREIVIWSSCRPYGPAGPVIVTAPQNRRRADSPSQFDPNLCGRPGKAELGCVLPRANGGYARAASASEVMRESSSSNLTGQLQCWADLQQVIFKQRQLPLASRYIAAVGVHSKTRPSFGAIAIGSGKETRISKGAEVFHPAC